MRNTLNSLTNVSPSRRLSAVRAFKLTVLALAVAAAMPAAGQTQWHMTEDGELYAFELTPTQNSYANLDLKWSGERLTNNIVALLQDDDADYRLSNITLTVSPEGKSLNVTDDHRVTLADFSGSNLNFQSLSVVLHDAELSNEASLNVDPLIVYIASESLTTASTKVSISDLVLHDKAGLESTGISGFAPKLQANDTNVELQGLTADGSTGTVLLRGFYSTTASKAVVNKTTVKISDINILSGSLSFCSKGVDISGFAASFEISDTNLLLSDVDFANPASEDFQAQAVRISESNRAAIDGTRLTLSDSTVKAGSAPLNLLGIGVKESHTVQITDARLEVNGITNESNNLQLSAVGSGVQTLGSLDMNDTEVIVRNVYSPDGNPRKFSIMGADILLGTAASTEAAQTPSVVTADIRKTEVHLFADNIAKSALDAETPSSAPSTNTEADILGVSVWGMGEEAQTHVKVDGTLVSVMDPSGQFQIQGVITKDVDSATINDTCLLVTSWADKPAPTSGEIIGVSSSVRSQASVDGTRMSVGPVKFTGDVIASKAAIFNDDGGTISVTNSQVSLFESEITGNVTAADVHQNGRDNLTVTGNKVVLDDSVVSGTVAAGWVSDNNGVGKGIDRGNTIEVVGVSSAGALEGFDTLVLKLSKDNLVKPVLTVTGLTSTYQAAGTETVLGSLDLKDRTLVLENFDPEQNYKLIDASSIAVNENSKAEADLGFIKHTWNYTGDQTLDSLSTSDFNVKGAIKTALPSSKTLAEAMLGSIALVNQGAEFIADNALTAAVSAARDGTTQAFGAVHGGHSRYNTGSHVDLDSISFAVGTSVKLADDTVLAGFVEYGSGNSESHVSGTTGDGDHRYYGLGIALQHGFANGLYINGSARFGQSETEFAGSYAIDSATYESESLYGSAHLGVGFKMPVTDSINADLYSRYTFTWTDSDDVGLSDSQASDFSMSTTTAHAFRLGARLTGVARDVFTWHTGLAYEHVAGADAESTVNGIDLEAPTLEGDTEIAELGVSIKPTVESKWSFDLGVKGYVGDREGLSGNLMIRRIF